MSEQAEVDTVDDDHHDDDDDVIVLSWWHNPVNLIVMGIGLILVVGALGWVLGNNHAQPDPNDVDVGFLQDMHWHHDQAVQMALIYLSDTGTDPALRQAAEEILVGQNQEIGLMIQMLRDFGKADTNETDTGMAWMGDPTPLDSMPGMATEAQLDQLGQASGAEADAVVRPADDRPPPGRHPHGGRRRAARQRVTGARPGPPDQRFAGRGDRRDAAAAPGQHRRPLLRGTADT